jgi:hypothetical protein
MHINEAWSDYLSAGINLERRRHSVQGADGNYAISSYGNISREARITKAVDNGSMTDCYVTMTHWSKIRRRHHELFGEPSAKDCDAVDFDLDA